MSIDTIDGFLWACTFGIQKTATGDYYNTYTIGTDGIWGGLLTHEWFASVIDQFSDIARWMIAFDVFEEYSALWYASFNAALCAANEKRERKEAE